MQIKAKLKISVILCLVLTEVKCQITGSLVPGRGAKSIPRSRRIHILGSIWGCGHSGLKLGVLQATASNSDLW